MEIIDGSLYVSPMQSLQHGLVSDAVYDALRDVCPRPWRVRHGQPMLRPDSPSDRDLLLIPDVAVTRADAVAVRGGLGIDPSDFLLAVEVLSPSTRSKDLGVKLDAYRSAGVGAYWTVEPEHGSVKVHWSSGEAWVDDVAHRSFA